MNHEVYNSKLEVTNLLSKVPIFTVINTILLEIICTSVFVFGSQRLSGFALYFHMFPATHIFSEEVVPAIYNLETIHEHHKEKRSNLENPCIHKKAHCQMYTFLWVLIWWTPNDMQPRRSDRPFRSSLCQTDSNKRFLSSSSRSSLNIIEKK